MNLPQPSLKQLDWLEKTVAYLSIGGALLVSNEIPYGWLAYLVASILGMWWSYLNNYRHMLMMNIFFTLANLCGIWNYLIKV